MEPHQQRVVDEQAQLKERIDKLANFINARPFAQLPVAEAALLLKQLQAMHLYNAALVDRIDLWKPT
jgi:hypothetical protein